MKIEIVTNYCSDDPKFSGDFCEVDIYIDEQLVISYGDYYHDKGWEKVEGFLDAVGYLVPNVEIKKTKTATYPC